MLAEVIDVVSPSTVTVLLDAVPLNPEPVIVADAPSVQLVGETLVMLGTMLTVTEAVALTDPDVAVIVGVPSATAVTSPADDTVATDEFDVVHVTVAPDMVFPAASFTVAVSVTVSPPEVKVLVLGETVTVEAA